MDITEESKALLEEYNKTVSFVLVGLVGVLPQPVSATPKLSSHSALSLHPSGHTHSLSASSFRPPLSP